MRGVKTCFKNINLCDQHPVCDPAEETEGTIWDGVAQDEIRCLEKYKENGLTPKEATYKCQSVHHNEESVADKLSLGIVLIEAVPCDGKPSCWKKVNETFAQDESFCDSDFLTIWGPGVVYDSFLCWPMTPRCCEKQKILPLCR